MSLLSRVATALLVVLTMALAGCGSSGKAVAPPPGPSVADKAAKTTQDYGWSATSNDGTGTTQVKVLNTCTGSFYAIAKVPSLKVVNARGREVKSFVGDDARKPKVINDRAIKKACG